MSQAETPILSSVVAVYPDHATADCAVRQLHEAGFALGDLSIVGRDFQVTEEPYGFVSRGDYVKAGAGTGAWFGGVFGLFIGVGFLILPGLGFVVVAGPIAAVLLAGIRRDGGGNRAGQPGGRLVGWRVPKDRALKYETQVKGGKFLVVVRSIPRSSPAPGGCSHPGAGSHRGLQAAGILNATLDWHDFAPPGLHCPSTSSSPSWRW